ncbi:MAG: peptidyl-tRNA hydrolase [Candidatus Synechococcus spongiarum 15L]|uniref:Peptidyl-tRNA hydrolase n=3 Tax=Candidatus Synechococcus spongiarum TaxID=431041 RepID=A0A1T1CRJ2_9SYNE|nr:aminoacyl-tRNA hydrolase [Candidatus Synechococcus spongiarum]KKZ14253.1 MAG: peptidyl-tRNA hydrolase [Candidatus Synechococcus spongiarum 15L]MCY4360017.1 aminoacyl-tRNA hydrolase [Cyanobacteria bacterium MAG APA_bin_95]OOV31229.1 aminoacyl-tRNA hydrolase [Candidatus Synechococcus spongiarum LMB bulk15M]OOV36496.1 aminoacyl-tRNA hydrolase [Candidatus Synechococcus spongiarum LMB bulk15N]
MDLRLIAGLGNPGARYAGTRHNAGFMVLEAMASSSRAGFRNQTRLKAHLAEVGWGEQRLRLLMPQTYMNASGISIRAALDWFNLRPEHLLVVVDDMDLPLGRLRLRGEGSDGGHKGLHSTIAHLNTQAFARLRVGIGAPSQNPAARKAATVGHVLGRFSAEEDPLLRQVLHEVVRGIHVLQRQGLGAAMNTLNGLRIQAHSTPGITH